MTTPGSLGVDHAARPADYPSFARELYARGYRFEWRYLCQVSHPEDVGRAALNAMKIARPSEVKAALAAGLDVAFVWQDTKLDARGGRVAGALDGADARAQARALGVPLDVVLYFAVADYDAAASDHDVIADYLAGAAGTAAPYRIGGYGKNTVGADMLRRGLVVAWFQSYGFSRPIGKVEPWASCYQGRVDAAGVGSKAGDTVAGVPLDVDTAGSPTIGAWLSTVDRMTLGDALGARLVTRAAWGAVAPKTRTALTASFGSTIHHEGPPLGAYDHTSCPSKVRGIQRFHMEQRGWSDIAYSMMVCRHGAIFECRGRGIRTAANGTNPGNDQAHAVCALVGTGDEVTPELLEGLTIAAAWLNQPAEHGDGINGHRDWKPTACPNDVLYGRLPAIRFRAVQLTTGSTQPDPPSAVVIGPELKEEDMHEISFTIPVSPGPAGGRGYVDLRKGFAGLTESISPNRVVSVTFGGADPADGWDQAPTRPLQKLNVGGVARIVIAGHEVTNGPITVFATVA